ncbi:hypothetical protein M011DRAFT_399332 [Sporormia fimetaria CBS 119925]|uniref:Cnl2/NKP2 family protein-domain-containing protein n=1 Tax=Sporormia fimetaria CBS 119925 TaxID=1340428 RepID=A0A6A6VGR1_9PLEO|nr:hypothetical protein M011DRAFT_399332 [Sporormia fimetaria CBS 119925]
MPSQEATLLANFLLAPAALRNVLTFDQFAAILPSAQRSNPAVRDLYQELERLRNEDIQAVRENINDEIKASRPLRRACARRRKEQYDKAVAGLDLVALETERELSGDPSGSKPHTLRTIQPSIQEACQTIEAQIEEMESELQGTMQELKEVAGDLSDLRYGSFPKSVAGADLTEEVLATLERLEAACEGAAG